MRRITTFTALLALACGTACSEDGQGGDGGGTSISTSGGSATTASTNGSGGSGDSGGSSGSVTGTSATSAGSDAGTTGGSTGGATTTASTGGSATATSGGGGGAIPGCFHSWTFESCPGDWTASKGDAAAPGAVSWACGDPDAAFSLGGAHTGVWATNLTGDYNEEESSLLTSPEFSLADCAGATVYLTLAHLYSFGSGDGGTVQVSSDGGQTWTTVVPSWNSYCAGTLSVPFAPPGGEPGFCDGNDELWMHTLIPLDSYAGQPSVLVRLAFGSDGTIEDPGWYVDAVGVEAYP